MSGLNLFFDLRSCPGGATQTQLATAAIEMCRWADAQPGLATSVGFPEHHGAVDGYLSAPLVMASAVAGATREMNITVILLIPFYEPIRLAEDLAVLDLVSRGRVTVVAAAGYVPYEFQMFDVDPATRGRRLEETVNFLKAAWQGEELEFQGRRVRVTPRPFQDARPVIMMAGSSKAAARRAARIADGFWPTTNPELMTYYRSELEKMGVDPGPPPQPPGPMQTLVAVAEDPDAVWEKVGEFCAYEINAYAQWQQEGFPTTDKVDAAFGEHNPYRAVTDLDALRQSGRYLVLSPEECVAWAAAQDGQLTINPLTGGIDPTLAWESLRVIESAVLPHLVPSERPPVAAS
jgi:alkanesulfonate monooxygenase SsuD/methylene tetrahydromethanopterin reductase-like flavin-dependent oxidoreductase (luciferase family)